MSKHTQGPWSVVDGHYPSMREIQGPSFKINIVMSATDLNFQDYLSRSADARLIAAAPELLEALIDIADDYSERFDMDSSSTNPGMKSVVEAARAAIRKALGEE